MIAAIVLNGFRALRRDRGALILSFILPIAFFSIFAMIFGGMGGKHAARQRAGGGRGSQRRLPGAWFAALRQEPSLDASTAPKPKRASPFRPITRPPAPKAAVKQGTAPAALIIPKGFGAHPISLAPGGEPPRSACCTIVPTRWPAQMVGGMLQKVVMTSFARHHGQSGHAVFRGQRRLTPQQRRASNRPFAYRCAPAQRRCAASGRHGRHGIGSAGCARRGGRKQRTP
jgi:ABC-2 type transport system permease protein